MPRRSALLAPWLALAVLGSGGAVLSTASSAYAATPSPPAPVVPAPAPDPAAVEALQRAEAEVAALTADADRATAELTAGTVALEQGQARLAATQEQAAQSRAAADAALARAAASRALLANIVNAAYRTPRPDAVTLALGAQPGRLEEVVLADAALDHVHGNQQHALQVASEQGEQAGQLAAQADALNAQVAEQQRGLEAQVAALQSQAEAIRARLQAAADRLSAARAAAAAAAVAPPLTGPLPADPSGGAALCAGASTVGYPNGFLPAEALCPLSVGVGVGHRLRADAAAAFNRMAAVRPLCVTDSYRSYGEQVDVYARKPGLAAVPGTSNHGLGVAVDFCGGVETFGTPAFAWMQANAPRYGFVHPAWAEPGGSRPEPWHWEYVGVPAAPR